MRRLDRHSLRRAAEHHLARHPATRAGLTRVLARRVASHVRKSGTPAPADIDAIIAETVSALVAEGLVDDRRLAESRARSLRARGKSARAVRVSLEQKGVERSIVGDVLENAIDVLGATRSPKEAELTAARILVRKKKLGAMREPALEVSMRAKDLATLGRAGFAYDVARRALSDPHGDTEDGAF